MKKITFFTLCLTLFLAGNLYSQQTIWCSATGAGLKNGTSEANAFDLFSDAIGQINSAGDILRVVGTVTMNGPQSLNTKNFQYTIEGDAGGSTLIGADAQTRMFTINAASVGQNVTFKNIKFTGSTNSTGTGGGGVFYSQMASVTINFENCRFEGNSLVSTVVNGGGAIFVSNSTVNITDCLFKENTALQRGGAIAIGVGAKATITRSTFYKNKSTTTNNAFGGGALFVTGAGAVVNVYNCTFFQNTIGHTNQAYSTIRTEGGITKVYNSLFNENRVNNGTGGPGDWGSAAGLSSTITNSVGQWINGNVTNTSSNINTLNTLFTSTLVYDDISGKVKYTDPTTPGDATPISFGTDGNDAGAWNSPNTWTGTSGTSWTDATNWSIKGVPGATRDALIATASNQPIIASNASVASLTLNASTSLTVNSDFNLTVTGAVANSGTMTIENNANLIQGGTTNTNTGAITVKRNSNALKLLDYTLWSSPVAGQDLLLFSPNTSLTPYIRFYNYNETTNLYNSVPSPSGTPFAAAAGYLIRMPKDHPTEPTVWNGSFSGVPNNGDISKSMTYNGADFGYNLVGNPYPSTIDANAFITANTANIESSLYFWRKTNGAGGSAYAVHNPTGGTSAASSEIPNGTIQVGQGFFVKAKSAGNVNFTNAMRTGTKSTQFFKTKQVAQKDRVWLNLTSAAGVFSQTLVGYIADATLGVDMYDAKYINDSPVALTSNINNEEYTIQGRPAFDPADVVALNFKTDADATYTIALDHFDGVFATGQDVYLVDSKTGIETDLKAGAYTFSATSGVDNARFSLKYQKTLKVDAAAFNENSVSVYKNNGALYVNSGFNAMSNIKVFDIQGRLIAEQKNLKSTTAVFNNLRAKNQVLIVKIAGENNNVVSKKILN